MLVKGSRNDRNGNAAFRGINQKRQNAPLRYLFFEAEEIGAAINPELKVLGAVVYPVIQTSSCGESVGQNDRGVDAFVETTAVLHDTVEFDRNRLQSIFIERLVDLVFKGEIARPADLFIHKSPLANLAQA